MQPQTLDTLKALTSGRRPLRIACFGYAESGAGSVADAGMETLAGLLDRGHEIDFFNKRSFVYPTRLIDHPRFRYVDTPNRRAEALCQKVNGRGGQVTQFVLGAINHATFARGIISAMRREHAARRYDLQVALGEWAFGKIGGIPSVSWVQGPPETDSCSVIERAAEVRRLCGNGQWLKLRAFTLYRRYLALPRFSASDVVVCGSRWSMRRLATYGVGESATRALPYPIDLGQFTPQGKVIRPGQQPRTMLWLGRTVPRKRLDLFLGALRVLIGRGVDVRGKVIGGFGWAAGYRQLIEQFEHPDRLEYVPGVARALAPQLLREADVVVQPSEDENFGSTVAEAMACGTPVVVGPTNGTGDYVGTAGRIFDRYDAESVADAIAGVFDDLSRDADGMMARAARAQAERAFAVETVINGFERVMQEAIGAATGAATRWATGAPTGAASSASSDSPDAGEHSTRPSRVGGRPAVDGDTIGEGLKVGGGAA